MIIRESLKDRKKFQRCLLTRANSDGQVCRSDTVIIRDISNTHAFNSPDSTQNFRKLKVPLGIKWL